MNYKKGKQSITFNNTSCANRKKRQQRSRWSRWSFQPIWKILVKLGHFPRDPVENKTYLKPPTRDELKLLNFLGQKKWCLDSKASPHPPFNTTRWSFTQQKLFWNALQCILSRIQKRLQMRAWGFWIVLFDCSVLTVNMSIDFSYIRVIYEWMDRHISFISTLWKGLDGLCMLPIQLVNEIGLMLPLWMKAGSRQMIL